jgi:hypothetical protein
MSLHVSNHPYIAFSDEPVSGYCELDLRVSTFLKAFKESSWLDTFDKSINLDTLNMNVHLAKLLMLISTPKQTLSQDEHLILKKVTQLKNTRCSNCLCPWLFVACSSVLMSGSIGLCYYFSKDPAPLNTVNMTLILSLSALVSLVASQIFMHVITAKRAQKLARLSLQEMTLWEHFEQDTLKPVAREWLKLFAPKALDGESHHKFKTRRKLAVIIHEQLDFDHLVNTFKNISTCSEKLDHMFFHLNEARRIIERQLAYETLNIEFISTERLYYNLTGTDVGLFAHSLNYFKPVSNRWEI